MASPQRKSAPSETLRKSKSDFVSREELLEQGKAHRKRCPRVNHSEWSPPGDRLDAVKFVEESDKGRLPELIPIRHGRMLVSPFTFYRGSAGLMASDLSHTPISGIYVQACGDAHLCNFGAFATPERNLIFAINDLDETLPAPWEWDVKRLAASFVIASRNNKFRKSEGRDAAMAAVRSYREHMKEYTKMTALEIWYEKLSVDRMMSLLKDQMALQRLKKRIKKARATDVMEDLFPKLAEAKGNRHMIREDRPLIFHWNKRGSAQFERNVHKALSFYRDSLPPDRRTLYDRYHLKDIAIKVVGVGSVGTVCWVLLMMAQPDDVLFLQIKQANRSVLEAYAGKSPFPNHGQRVVHGQRIIQSASDIFLGWTRDTVGRHYYVRQLRDMKIKPLVELFNPGTMTQFAEFCGWVMAHAHARSGEPALISGYLGGSDKFDQAIADFSEAYADQNEKDYDAFAKACRAGKFEVNLEAV